MRDDLVLNFGVSVEKTIVINNPVDVDRIRGLARESVDTGMEKKWGNADRRPQVNLVAAGRMKFEKGLDLLIEALALCCNPSLHLTLLGEGPLLHDLKALAILKGVGEQVRFVGFQKNPYPFLSQADFFVLSSRSEGFPNVVLEAMACGTPIIATPLDVMKEMLKDVRGCVIADEATAAGLARAMQSLASGRRLPMDVVETYSAPNIVSQYAQVLNGIR
jgi:glycosyltransferase involved in cell wall biosynthesis